MAARLSPFEPPSPANAADNDYFTEHSPSPTRPLSGPGTSRQARRLQLRNAGFRGGAVPTRKVTPKSNSSGGPSVSDAENVSPAGTRTSSLSVGKRQSSGVLQEIGNSTLTRPKRTRPRITSAKLFASMNNAGTSALGEAEPLSPPQPKTSIRAKVPKTRAKMTAKRRSVSSEMSKYIDHLETELASAQSQLSAITSPTVTREQSSKVRNLNAETKQLQQELDEWETKYEQRVQDALDEHVTIENSLRSRIRSLEEDAQETQYRLQELEMQLEESTEKMTATESANVNLEKRLEIMSELLAASPTKIDLHAETPGRRRRQQRPQSMLPRFPTASSLVCSPERQSFTQPTSPLLSFANNSPSISFSPTHDPLRLDASPHPSDVEQTDVESVFSDGLGTADSITSVETSEAQSAFNPWNLPPIKAKRRMRRFHGGSMGPKPLILPATSACEQFPPSSAPPLERSETTPALFQQETDEEEAQFDLAIFGRRRASTMAGDGRVSSLGSPPPFLDVPRREEGDESMVSALTPHADQSRDVSQDYSTIGSKVGRNLMEELSAMSTNESSDTIEESQIMGDGSTGTQADGRPSSQEALDKNLVGIAVSGDGRIPSSSTATQRPGHSRTRSRSNSSALHPNLSIFDRLRLLFGDLWRSPVTLARHLVQNAQSRMRLPSPLLNAQWWLVGILLGPMARRRMLSRPRPDCCAGAEDGESLVLHNHDQDRAEADQVLAYGPYNPSPPASPPTRKGSLGGKGCKRASSKTHRCTHAQHRRKHSPLMWLKFSLTLAFAVGAAFKDGPGSLLKGAGCACWVKAEQMGRSRIASSDC